MSKFLSAIVTKDLSVLCDPENTNSHRDLIILHNFTDPNTYVCVEFTPPKKFKSMKDPTQWILSLPEVTKPEWYDETVVRNKLENIVSGMFVSKNKNILVGGCHILTDGVVVDRAVNAYIYAMLKESRINTLTGASFVGLMDTRTFIDRMFANSSVNSACFDASIGEMNGLSSVKRMYNTSSVNTMLDESRVESLDGASTVGTLKNLARVDVMSDNSSISNMYNESSVGSMWERSSVGALHDESVVDSMQADSTVFSMYNHTCVQKMSGKAHVRIMHNNAVVRTIERKSTVGEIYDDARILVDTRKELGG